MNGFSTADGFVEIIESLAEMINYVANDPSVGLLYVQKHTQDTVPNIINLSGRIAERSRESRWHSEDSEDSITMVRSMKECGFPIVDEMIKDIKNSLTLVSAKQQRRGSIAGIDSGYTRRRTKSWGSITWGYGSVDTQQDGSNYISTIFKSARLRASSLKWFQLEAKEAIETEPLKPVHCPAPPVPFASGLIPNEVTGEKVSNSKWPELESKGPIEAEPQKLVRSQSAGKLHEAVKVGSEDDAKLSGDNLFFVAENYDEFKADKESKLEQWLEGSEGKLDESKGESDTGGV
ncbi:hypothetical protein HRI_001728300 [Hibiscus trionum]|uniref:Uncharacterized protein n=1 Tax=Hibiscus trionum TaxID=183268 RepID=A0A9W7HRE5_HIBTR|nr:hypothetical protein HRI_001728300 [Hibiscus trionum]